MVHWTLWGGGYWILVFKLFKGNKVNLESFTLGMLVGVAFSLLIEVLNTIYAVWRERHTFDPLRDCWRVGQCCNFGDLVCGENCHWRKGK